ncbi:MAG TPA: potassium channel protein [Terriglobales bacterium]|nr:potassium channel protein [Terriglobales bacterium]
MRALRNLKLIAAALLLLTLVGMAGFHFIEGWPWFDGFYMVVTTFTTIGYQEVHPLSHAGRVFNAGLIITGVVLVFLGIGSLTQALLEFELGNFFGRRRMERDIGRLTGHTIICGAGRVGRSVARELARKPAPFLVVDTKPEKLERLEPEWLSLVADATQEEALRRARIEQASGLVAATTLDATNIYIVLTARSLNPKLKIIARASEEGAEKHLLTAGADSVISPYLFAGHRIAQAFLRPNVLDFLDVATARAGKPGLEIEEIRIAGGSAFVGKTLEASGIRQDTGAIVLAIQREGQAMRFNPAPDDRIQSGDFLIAMGEPAALRRLEQQAATSSHRG